jgi:hypothetical protein
MHMGAVGTLLDQVLGFQFSGELVMQTGSRVPVGPGVGLAVGMKEVGSSVGECWGCRRALWCQME